MVMWLVSLVLIKGGIAMLITVDKKVLNREVKIEDNTVVIIENTETKLTKHQLEMQLRDIQFQKEKLKEQNQRIINDYNQLVEKEIEINNLIAQLTGDEKIQEI